MKAENPLFAGDVGFRVFKLDSSNIREWDQAPADVQLALDAHKNPIKPERTDDDVLFELLLKLGLDLCVPIEAKKIAGKKVHAIGGGVLFACLEKKIAQKDAGPLALGIAEWKEKLTPAGDVTCVFRDSAFENDIAKTNLTEILKQHDFDPERIRSL